MARSLLRWSNIRVSLLTASQIFQLMAQAYGIKNYKFDNPETLEKDLEVILEDVPMFIEVDIFS